MYHMRNVKKAFTLIEMLIVIVIIGILATALIPRLIGIQARARDTARDAGMRTIVQALELYAVDNLSKYPSAVGSVDDISTQIDEYVDVIPTDVDNGLVAQDDDSCSEHEGDYYAYIGTNTGYVVTADIESNKGNTDACNGSAPANE